MRNHIFLLVLLHHKHIQKFMAINRNPYCATKTLEDMPLVRSFDNISYYNFQINDAVAGIGQRSEPDFVIWAKNHLNCDSYDFYDSHDHDEQNHNNHKNQKNHSSD